MKALLLALLIYSVGYAQTVKKPIVFIHGFMASGDTWSRPYSLFLENGYTAQQLQVFDWNTINGKGSDSLLNVFIDSILVLNKATQVDLVGHSAGGGLGYKYCSNAVNAKKVAHYVHIGSMPLKKPAGPNAEIPTQIIFSTADYVAQKAKATDGAINLKLSTKDHYEVATCDSSFTSMFQFFNNYTPELVWQANKKPTTVWVKCLYFATNVVLPNCRVQVQQYNPGKGIFIGNKKTYTSNAQGWFSFTVNAQDKNNYAITIQPNAQSRAVTYFFNTIQHSKIISLRAFNTDNIIGMLLAQLPKDSSQPALCIFSGNKAIVSGRDTLTVNNIAISGPALTPAEKTIIASFVYDDGDKKSSATKHPALAAAPFMNGVDVFVDATKEKKISIAYNQKTISLPLIPAHKGIMVVVVE
jgi:Lipase (class 2)